MTPNTITRDMWEEKEQQALQYMEHKKTVPGILIEVSTQHPLVDGLFPNEEYAERLDRAVTLREQLLKEEPERLVHILLAGSQHKVGEHTDKISLSKAGENYLRTKGIPQEVLLGENMIDTYKGPEHRWPGVYNSADEAYVAVQTFKNGPYGRIICVASLWQVYRKQLNYLWNGVVPDMETIAPKQGHHSLIHELYRNIPNVLHVDPDWQAEDSDAAKNSRIQRRVVEEPVISLVA